MTARKVSIGLVLAAILGLLATTSAQAEVVSNVSYAFSAEHSFPNGDHVGTAGDLHVLTAVTIDKQGGEHVVQESNPQGIGGVSDYGVTYHGTGVHFYQHNVKDPSYPLEFTQVVSHNIIGDGPSNDFTWHLTIHTTINANGETTVEFGMGWMTFGDDGPK
jgi:hypothetical protein